MASPVNSNHYSYSGQHGNQYSTSSPPPAPKSDGSDGQNATKHRRGYQACEGCRARKVACKMGDVDNPTEGKCQRCKREMKQCVFAATRKKAPRASSDGSSANTPTGALSGASKRKQSDMSYDDQFDDESERKQLQNNLPPGFLDEKSPSMNNRTYTNMRTAQPPGMASIQTIQAPRSAPESYITNNKNNGSNNMFANVSPSLPRPNVVKPSDDLMHRSVAQAFGGNVTTTQHTMATLLEAADKLSDVERAAESGTDAHSKKHRNGAGGINGGRAGIDPSILDAQPDSEIEQAIRTWSRARFVKAGWISSEEAMNYIEFFYRELAPMTPVKLPDFRPPRTHYVLLTEEPVLALVIFMISSRHMPLQGQASVSRSHEVHRQFWQALQGMIQRLLWGQEQFGGGFCGAGMAPVRESVTGQITWAGSLRTLGTIDALLLLTDWQPRALHFPPGQSENDLIDRNEQDAAMSRNAKDDDTQNSSRISVAAALEPGWRSDRMSWMLLGIAQSLAFELGVFDNNHDDCGYRHGPDSDCLRKRRLRRLVVIYVTQTSGRLGIKCMLSPETDADRIFDNDSRRHSDETDLMQMCWFNLATIMFSANVDIFSTKKRTHDLSLQKQYKVEIAKLTPRLEDWKKTFDRVRDKFHPIMQHVMSMEYEYARMFINSVGFNKVVESWIQVGPKIEPSAVAQIAAENRVYSDEVRSASKNILYSVLQGFAEKNQLRNAAIRTYLRSFAGMVFTLKLFSLGNNETVVKEYLRLLDRIVLAMESQVVDDVHICTTIAAQVKNFTQIVKNTMIRIRKPGNGSGPPSREVSRVQSPKPEHTYRPSNHLQEIRYPNHSQPPSPDDPLAEIQARPIADFSDRTFLMPPGFNSAGDDNAMNYDSSLDPAMNEFNFEHTDWLTLPLDNILEGGIGSVEAGMSGVGPLIGNRDMLEWFDPMNDNMSAQWNMLPNNQGNGFGGMNGF